MNRHWTRRNVLQASTASGVFMGVSGWGRLNEAAPVVTSAANDDAEIERVAELIFDTPPDRIAEVILDELRRGLSRQQLLAASFNAGTRFHGHHSAYVAHPIRVVADEITVEASLLPLFYYLSVLRFRAGKPDMRRMDTSKLPSKNAAQHFHASMNEGDRDAAGRAMIAMCRQQGPQQAYQHLWIYGAQRNHNSGGHTAVSVVNTYRTLQSTDWRCAETALHFAVTDEAWRPPGGSDVHAVNLQRANQVDELPTSWSSRQSRPEDVRMLLDMYRQGRPDLACETTFGLMRDNQVTAGSVWDAVFLTTAELVIRYKWVGSKMLAGHSVTCTNALHYMFRHVTDPATRLYAVLEAVEWATSFLQRERARPALRPKDITEMEPVDLPRSNETLEQIFSLLPPRRFASIARPGFEDVDQAMRIAFAWAKANRNHRPFIETAQRLMCTKSTPEVHDFKYPMALFENYRYASAEWKPYLLAASVHVLQGTAMEDSQIVLHAREHLKG